MNNYKQNYGVINKDNGVEFYIELNLKMDRNKTSRMLELY